MLDVVNNFIKQSTAHDLDIGDVAIVMDDLTPTTVVGSVILRTDDFTYVILNGIDCGSVVKITPEFNPTVQKVNKAKLILN